METFQKLINKLFFIKLYKIIIIYSILIYQKSVLI